MEKSKNNTNGANEIEDVFIFFGQNAKALTKYKRNFLEKDCIFGGHLFSFLAVRILLGLYQWNRRIPEEFLNHLGFFFKNKNSDYNWVRIFQEFFEQTTAEESIPLQFKEH